MSNHRAPAACHEGTEGSEDGVMRRRDPGLPGSPPEQGRGKGRRILIGGVGYRWQGDLSLGLVAADELARLQWPPGVEIADLGYGAIYVAQDLADAQPPYERVILLAGVARGREPGRIYCYRWGGVLPDADEIQARVREAGAGVIDLDHLLIIAQHFGALPQDVVVVEVEPLAVSIGDNLSPAAADLLPKVIALVRREALAPPRRHAETT